MPPISLARANRGSELTPDYILIWTEERGPSRGLSHIVDMAWFLVLR